MQAEQASTQVQNSRGQWVPAIPEPYYMKERSTIVKSRKDRCRCECGRILHDYETYRGHFALVHILALS
jgi:hypothetical protein